IRPILAVGRMRVLPKLARNLERIDAGGLPPGPLVAGAMSCTVMDTAKWHCEFITCLTTKGTGLQEPQMMCIRRLGAAQETRLEGNVAKMLAVAVPPWRSDHEDALIDACTLIARRNGRWRLLLRSHLYRYSALDRESFVHRSWRDR